MPRPIAPAARAAGPAPPARCPRPATLPQPYPFETIDARAAKASSSATACAPGTRQFGEAGPWLAFAPLFQIANAQLLQGRGAVPGAALPRRRDGPARQRQLGPADRRQSAYTLRPLLRRLRRRARPRSSVERAALVGISAAAMIALRLAAEQPERVSHLVIAGGLRRTRRIDDPATSAGGMGALQRMRDDWPAYLDEFFGIVFSEPHSTKPYEDGVLQQRLGHRRRRPSRWAWPAGWATTCASWRASVALPDAGDPRRRRPPRAVRQRRARSPRWCRARSC